MDHYLRPHTKINSRRATAVAALAYRGGGQKGKDHWQREVHRQCRKVQGSTAGLAVPCPTFRSITNTGKFTCDNSLKYTFI